MRTKEALDRQSQEDQERAWIYMLHNQAPPLTRRPLATPTDAHTPSGFIPLAPLAAHAPSPLVAARAAAASLALHVNGASAASPGTWPSAVSQRSPASRDHGMVKLEKGPHSSTGPVSASSAASQKKTPLLGPLSGHSAASSVVFRSRMHTPGAVPEAPTPLAHVHRSTGGAMTNNSLMGVLTKRPREEEFVERHDDEECDYESGDESSARGQSGKRACLPKKCDFPMCKNSSRSRGFCYSHGGGRRCRVDGCANGAVSRDLCKRHGGGRRCRISGCKSSSESGGLCYSHGGGRRCNLSWCNARAKKGGYCAAHVDNRNALPPVDVIESERHENEIDRAAMVTKAPIKIAARPLDAAATSVNPQVVETLLLLSKSPSQSESEDNNDNSTGADHLLSPRLSNPYAIASILN